MTPLFTVAEIAEAVCGTLCGFEDGAVNGVSTDSRTVGEGELFIPLKGERFDGHDYVDSALRRGVRVFLSECERCVPASLTSGITCITVKDTLQALGDLAAYHRNRFRIPLIAVTGSNGKTTTKEMLAAILGRTGAGLKTSGNLNNLIGLPLMLLQLREDHHWAVLEMGMSEPGEIDRLAEIARPDVGVITNVSPAHLQTMGSISAVASAKGELFMRLRQGCCAVFNLDDPLVAAIPSPDGIRRVSFGFGEADVKAEDVAVMGREGLEFSISFPEGRVTVRLKAFGRHNVSNALAAAAAAHVLGIDPADVRYGLESFSPYDKRFAPEEIGDILLIDDSYNANPASMRAALLTLGQIKGKGRGIAVLGDMLELGEISVSAHEELGRLAADTVELLYVLGDMAEAVKRGATAGGLPASSILVARDHGHILDDLLGAMAEGDCILVKGSRGMRMESVADGIRSFFRSGTLKGVVT